MSADVFARRWLGLFALLAGLIAVSPWFLHVVVENSGCHGTSGACENMTLLMTLYGRRLILAAILIPLLLAVAGRALTVGAFVWALPFALVMLAGAAPLYFMAAEAMTAGAVGDMLASPAVQPLLFLILLLVALSAYPDESESGSARGWRAVLAVVALLTIFVTAPGWVPGMAELPWIGDYAIPTAMALARAHLTLGIDDRLPQLASYSLIGFVLATAGLVVSGDRSSAPSRPIRVMRA